MAARKARTISLVPDKVKKPSGLKKDGTPNASWRKFKERLDSYTDTPVANWGPDQALGHLFKRYTDHFDIDFSLSYSGPPSKCSEIYCTKRMMSMLGGENPDMKMVKEFIDWSFDSVIIPKKLQIESLAFFFAAKLVREFKAKYKKSKTITRATKLPVLIEQIAEDHGLDDSITTYGELAFAKKAVDADPENGSYKIYHEFFTSLTQEGFDYSVLQSLEG